MAAYKIQVEYLKYKYEAQHKQWIRPEAYVIQVFHDLETLPVDVPGD